MAIGLATGMGFLAIATVFTIIFGLATMFYSAVPFGEPRDGVRMLKITIPETLDYDEVFNFVLAQYTTKSRLVSVKTTNMGSLFMLTYEVILKSSVKQKAFIDDLRMRNGNLEISLGRNITSTGEL